MRGTRRQIAVVSREAGAARSALMAPAVVRVLMFSLVLLCIAGLGYQTIVRGLPTFDRPIELPWPLLALGFFVAELKVVEVHFRRETHAFSLTELPAVIGLFLVPPDLYLVALLVGSGAALALASRQPMLKLLFNLSNYLLVAVVTISVFRLIGRLDLDPEPRGWIAALLASLAASVVSSLTIATAITFSGGAPQFQKLPEMIQFGGLVALANASLALLAISILVNDSAAIWLMVVPLVTVFVAYRAYVSEREKHDRLNLLYQSSRILQHSAELDVALVSLLDHARVMFRAELAEVVLIASADASQALRTTSQQDSPPEMMTPIARPHRDARGGRDPADRRPVLATPTRTPGGRVMVIRQAMIAPLMGESGEIGTLAIVNRLTEGTKFGEDDLHLLETLANQAAVALENGQLEQSLAELSRLKEQLRYQAFHDPLTDLANRALFSEEVEARLRGSRLDASLPVVLFLDLDDFKVVNDTLGHAAGDELLVAVAERIRGSIREGDLAARLGGDEFAILMLDTLALDRAVAVARRLIDEIGGGFPIAGKDVLVGASIGIAMARQEGQGADELLRNADVAMYTAKAQGKRRFSVFEPTMHAALISHHQLSADLARAVVRGELVTYFQPIVALDDGATMGVEALVRWRHPARGLVGPDDFIPLAEETGSILGLGRWVMAQAATDVRAWNEALAPGRALSLSVNVSPVELQQADFLEQVETILRQTGFEPSRLIIEITENAMFRDTEASIAKLQALRERGVRIAIDDFGTGYSSLSYLRRFPVDILKIAKDFIVRSGDSSEEWAFAAAIVALGRTLDLQIIAEGIEEPGQLARLRSLGCEFGQGFLFAQPLPAASVTGLLGLASPDGSVGDPDPPSSVAGPVLGTSGAALRI
jgi:diguanylate cyclase (GGDEF)-like protein